MKRRLLLTAPLVAIVFALSGCSLLPLVGLGPTATSGEPTIGQCWNTTKQDADTWAQWRGSNAVSCSAPHDLYTFEIARITGIKAKTWAPTLDSQTLSNAVQAKAGAACNTKILLPHLKWNQYLIRGFDFVPTEAEWGAGARWVRCDIGIVKYGTTIRSERFAELPASISTLVSTVSSDPRRWELCVNASSPVTQSGPFDGEPPLIADCRGDPEWTLVGEGNLREPVGSLYPDYSILLAEEKQVCSKYPAGSNEVSAFVPPQPADPLMVGKYRAIECWIGKKNPAGK